MKLIKYIFFVVLTFIACQSDPCESVQCENGTCVEGVCDCPPGFYGDLCENSIFGTFAASSINSANCADDFVISSAARSPLEPGENICFPTSNPDILMCFWYRLELNQDFTFRTAFNQIAISRDGNAALLAAESPSGTYTFSNNQVTLSFTTGGIQNIDVSRESIFWIIEQGSSEFPECGIEVTYEKL